MCQLWTNDASRVARQYSLVNRMGILYGKKVGFISDDERCKETYMILVQIMTSCEELRDRLQTIAYSKTFVF